jgi:hypothetical protein
MNLHFPEHDKLEERYLDPPRKYEPNVTWFHGEERYWDYPPMSTALGLEQTFAMYFRKSSETHYDTRPMVKLTRVGGLVSLYSFYDFGRLPLHLGGGFGRVMWTALSGSKWLDFKTWGSFRLDVFIRDNGICQRCHKVIAQKDEQSYWPYQPPFVCDHIIPLFKGGKDWWEDPEMTNFQTLCEECNKIKTKHDVSKPKVIKQKLALKTIQYAGFVFEQIEPINHSLDKFILSGVKK